ncbi:aroma-sacti cluster domain-containing protein [Micromonospora sp. MS34]|uniref:aroma-sacti cluster domain-containing protein n=1 Tax=Micromonospora sp. MS34 TaxID=3385971 RepID=UPI00399EF4E3
MAYDALKALRDGGNPLDLLSERQRAVLANLTPEEVATWNSIKGRLDAAGGEVEGQDVNFNL